MDGRQLEADIENYRIMLYRIAYNSTGNFHDSEDIVQEAFIRLYTHKKSFKGDEAKKAWLIRVVINLCKNRNMLKWNRCRDEFSDSEVFADSGSADEFIDLENALKKLSPRCRTVIHLFYFEGFDTAEIADLLGISITAVTTGLQRGREKLKEFLD